MNGGDKRHAARIAHYKAETINNQTHIHTHSQSISAEVEKDLPASRELGSDRQTRTPRFFATYTRSLS